MDKEKLVLTVKIVMGIIFLFIPKISDFLTLESNAVGAYFVAFFIATCIAIGLSVVGIGTAIIRYVQRKK